LVLLEEEEDEEVADGAGTVAGSVVCLVFGDEERNDANESADVGGEAEMALVAIGCDADGCCDCWVGCRGGAIGVNGMPGEKVCCCCCCCVLGTLMLDVVAVCVCEVVRRY